MQFSCCSRLFFGGVGTAQTDTRQKLTKSHCYVFNSGPGEVFLLPKWKKGLLDEPATPQFSMGPSLGGVGYRILPGVHYFIRNRPEDLRNHRFIALEIREANGLPASLLWAADVKRDQLGEIRLVELTERDLVRYQLPDKKAAALVPITANLAENVADAVTFGPQTPQLARLEKTFKNEYPSSSHNALKSPALQLQDSLLKDVSPIWREGAAGSNYVSAEEEVLRRLVVKHARLQIGKKVDSATLCVRAFKGAEIRVPQTISGLFHGGAPVVPEEIREGDVLLFCTDGCGLPCTCGISLGGLSFLSTRNDATVAVESLVGNWARAFIAARSWVK